LQGRLPLRPDPELNVIAAGVLGRAQRLYPVDIVGYVVASNHYLLLVWAEDAERPSPMSGRDESRPLWRYQAIVVSDEEEAQEERFR
jgi:hypothetical protein